MHACIFQGWKSHQVSVPVIGGHSGTTIIPIMSQCKPDPQFTPEQVKLVSHQIRVSVKNLQLFANKFAYQ
jgi:malate/lactate dehydrogenase